LNACGEGRGLQGIRGESGGTVTSGSESFRVLELCHSSGSVAIDEEGVGDRRKPSDDAGGDFEGSGGASEGTKIASSSTNDAD
jgi:hypothetical protein